MIFAIVFGEPSTMMMLGYSFAGKTFGTIAYRMVKRVRENAVGSEIPL
jgi:hypothetical protein